MLLAYTIFDTDHHCNLFTQVLWLVLTQRYVTRQSYPPDIRQQGFLRQSLSWPSIQHLHVAIARFKAINQSIEIRSLISLSYTYVSIGVHTAICHPRILSPSNTVTGFSLTIAVMTINICEINFPSKTCILKFSLDFNRDSDLRQAYLYQGHIYFIISRW